MHTYIRSYIYVREYNVRLAPTVFTQCPSDRPTRHRVRNTCNYIHSHVTCKKKKNEGHSPLVLAWTFPSGVTLCKE